MAVHFHVLGPLHLYRITCRLCSRVNLLLARMIFGIFWLGHVFWDNGEIKSTESPTLNFNIELP